MTDMAELKWRYRDKVLSIRSAQACRTVVITGTHADECVIIIARIERDGRSAEGFISGLFIAGLASQAKRLHSLSDVEMEALFDA